MKKRLFAGALALLMIIGLLPVSSMLKKPVEAQAAQQVPHVMSMDTASYTGTSSQTEFDIGNDGYFKAVVASGKTFACGDNSKNTAKSGNSYKYDGTQAIKFNVTGASAVVTVEWMITSKNKAYGVTLSGDMPAGEKREYTTNTAKELQTSTFNVNSGEHKLSRVGGTVYLYSVSVVETVDDVTTSYTITVNDEHANPTTATDSYAEGSTLKLSAQGDNLLYWKNSNGVIVATGDKEIPVYYSDTYTAVYAKTGAKVEYLTPYGGVLATYYADDVNGADFKAPEGPTRYGYTFDGWDTDIETVKTSLVAEKDVTVSPKYKDNAGLQYTITIDATDVDGTKDTQTYTVNTVVKASVTDKDSFACWKVGDDVVSYNPTYYFFANRHVTVTAVKNDGSEVSKGAIITEVENSADNNTVIFEYTVPDEYEMTFAGVIASTNAESLASVKDDNITIPAGVYKLGADSTKCSNYNTYRYTLRKAGNDTWYVKPVLTYTDSTGSHTIYGNTVTMK